MGNLLIRDFPQTLKSEISKAANSNGRSISEEVKFRLRRDSEAFSPAPVCSGTETGAQLYDEMRAVFHGVFENDFEFEQFERELEGVRKNEFSRPPPDFD